VAKWQEDPARLGEPLWLAVNVSPRQLDDPGLPVAVAAALESSALAEGTLALELTESALMVVEGHRDVLDQLRDTGARLFLDDFGTGYSSLTHLTQLPISAVKIDKSFVAGVPGRHRQAAVVSALVALSGELGIEVIAEGVETSGQLQALQQMECRCVQGFLFDRPAAQPSLRAPTVPSRLLRRRPRRAADARPVVPRGRCRRGKIGTSHTETTRRTADVPAPSYGPPRIGVVACLALTSGIVVADLAAGVEKTQYVGLLVAVPFLAATFTGIAGCWPWGWSPGWPGWGSAWSATTAPPHRSTSGWPAWPRRSDWRRWQLAAGCGARAGWWRCRARPTRPAAHPASGGSRGGRRPGGGHVRLGVGGGADRR
jgi:EAL domain-containing protein (putative c-di-GMP-specific phosphodiesterase class I)